jgi:16S rRNA (guanine527-N7)-methyltransferase
MEKLNNGAADLGLDLTPAQLSAFELYYHELVEWNARFNLTAITNYEEVQVKHFLDSLTAVLVYDFAGNPIVLDIGTGAGFPGIPLKIAFPGIKLTLMEATAKKVNFLGNVISKLGLNGVETVTGRSEELAHDSRYREGFDVVCARAVAALPALAELALPFCKVGGIFIAYKKWLEKEEIDNILKNMDTEVELALPVCKVKDKSRKAQPTEVERAQKAIVTMGGILQETKKVTLNGLDDDRWLVVLRKQTPTPRQYPRRPGIPEKRPILA